MTLELAGSSSECVVLVTPTRRDAEVTLNLLASQRIEAAVASDLDRAEELIRSGAGTLVVTDPVLMDPDSTRLWQAIEQQPEWSNLPVIALCAQSNQSPSVALILSRLRNVTVLDRPTSTRTVISAVKAALRGRRWQYQIRDQIDSLVVAEQALRQADQHKDQFLATLAHELRNPLAPLRSGLELFAGDSLDRRQMLKINAMMKRQLGQLVRLVDELLDISRISTGKVKLTLTDLDLRRVIDQAVETCQPMLQRSGHELTVSTAPVPIRVLGDEARLSQSISNLLNNAIKYTPPGGRIALSVEAIRRDAVITLADTGIGVPDTMLERIFDKFTQIDRDHSNSQGGLGLGLALVRNLVQLHGGTVDATTRVVTRAARSLYGCLCSPELPRAQEGRGTGPVSGRETPAMRILVVDDNRDAAELLAMLLETEGHDVRVEYGGESGVKCAQEWIPEAVFCDLGMPLMDGLQVAAAFRNESRLQDVFLIALTGWGSTSDRGRSEAAGFNAHLTKPTNLADVRALLVQAHARRSRLP